jgi:hypothetical protein
LLILKSGNLVQAGMGAAATFLRMWCSLQLPCDLSFLTFAS